MKPTSPEQPDPVTRFREIDRIFREACRLEPDRRASFLDRACASDPAIRAEIEALLAEDADPFISDPTLHQQPPTPPPPDIPGFTIGAVIGVGGMGIVYEARQHRPSRRVALKVLRPGFHSTDRFKRFELEGEFLARLTHPSIAHIHDAGATSDHRPYFAMEFIDGRPITEHAVEAKLSTKARLELFLQVCDAVQHAHQHAVIHRDLKPSNILVTNTTPTTGSTTTTGQVGGVGGLGGWGGAPANVKILDFGIARAADTDIHAVTLQTDTGQLLGTLPYMSPEQATGDPSLIDTRTDLYSLGLLLFELLTNQRPRRLDHLAFADAIQAIRESEPTRLGSIDRALRGDLETIVGKTLERDKDRRYHSVSEFADDIRRHLQSEPISARPPSTLYQLERFTRRNRALVTGVGAVILALTLGLVGVSLALGRATEQRRRAQDAEALAQHRLLQTQDALDEAERQTDIARAVNDFLNNDLLAAADPNVNPAESDVTVRQALDAAARTIEGRFEDEPLVEATIRFTVATTYFNLGRYDDAIPHAERALALRLEFLSDTDPLIGDALDTLAVSLHFKGDLEPAEPLYKNLVARRRRNKGDDDPDTIGAITLLASLYADMGRYDDAEPLLVEAVDRGTPALGLEARNVLTAADNLAGLRYRQRRYDEAIDLFRKVLDARTRTLGPDSVDTIVTMASLALTLERAGKLDEAETLGRNALDEHRRVLGPEHPYTQTVQTNLGLLEIKHENFAEAERLIGEIHDLRVRTLGPQDPETLVSKAMLGRVHMLDGRYAQAEPLMLDAANGFIEVRGADHPYTLIAIDGCVTLYEKWDKPGLAGRWRAKRPESPSD